VLLCFLLFTKERTCAIMAVVKEIFKLGTEIPVRFVY